MLKILDLYCKAGGAGMGYSQAGYEVVGVDIIQQPNYPFRFIQSDAIIYLREHYWEFDVIHASPPCQRYSTMSKGLWKGRLENHPDLIEPTRQVMIKSGKPYIIENVPGSSLIDPHVLCGSMFGLGVRRHRGFETSFPMDVPKCDHRKQGKVVAVYGHSGGSSKRDGIKFSGVASWKEAMQIDWMIGSELAEAVPPAYTKYIGEALMTHLRG